MPCDLLVRFSHPHAAKGRLTPSEQAVPREASREVDKDVDCP